MRLALVAFLLLTGCVERRLFIKTDPPGALVRVNGKEIGRSPATWRFDHYGTVRVEAELDGRDSVEQVVELVSPAREWVLGGLVTDLLWPATIHDDHHVALTLPRAARRNKRAVDREIDGLQARALKLRAEANAK